MLHFQTAISCRTFINNKRTKLNRTHAMPQRPVCVNQQMDSKKEGVLQNSSIVLRSRSQIAETLNSRMAMLGFICGSAIEATTHNNYVEQIQTTYPFVVLMGLVIGYATLKTKDIGVDEKIPFTNNIELLNGRMAMMGILLKLVYDSYQVIGV